MIGARLATRDIGFELSLAILDEVSDAKSAIESQVPTNGWILQEALVV
jgi:hypothetical protein